MKKIIIFTGLFFLISSSTALGFVFGSSNLPIMGYPSFTSTHTKPFKPITKTNMTIEAYHNDVIRYSNDANEYIKSCDNDIQRIQEEASAARKAANSVIREHNSYMQTGY